ncbi:MAG: alpha/beta fold hydrolase, partial [Planctomycetota bacterium]
ITKPLVSPLQRDGKLPAMLYVQGIPCQTVDRPSSPEAADTRIIHAVAAAGFITMRVDKPGIGDSEGPPCEEIDLQTELEGFKAALKQLAAMPEVDPQRIFIFGHSMGGVLAPYLSASVPVRGSIVYGTLVRTWFEYQLENVRRQAALQPGASEAEITDAVLAEAKSSAMVLVDKKTLGDVWNRWPELRQPSQGVMLDENHMSTRSMPFFHQLQDLNLARAWQESTGAVLAMYGEYDWVTSQKDHEKIAEIVNGRTPGAGTVIVMPRADHGFTTHDSLQASVTAMGEGEWDAEIPKRMIEWMASVESGKPVASGATPAKKSDATATTGPSWQKLPTEPFPGKQDDIFFVNEKVGWYGNGTGKVFRTNDGGDTWTKVWERKGTFVRCLAFLDEQVGVMGNVGPGYFPGVTDAVPVYRTEDGGTTWTPVTTIAGEPVVGLCAFDIVQVPFVNAGNLDHRPRIIGVGRVGGPAAYIWSDDLGKTWKQGKLPEIATMAFDVRFLDEKHGFIASATDADVSNAHALILATEDGGTTWKEVYRSARPFELTWKFSFPDAKTGYCTIQSYNPDPAASKRFLAKTTDGGKTWAEMPLVDDAKVREFGIAFLDADTGWVGAMPHGFATIDGGRTWTKANFGNAVNKIRLLRGAEGVTGYAIGAEVHRLRLGKR